VVQLAVPAIAIDKGAIVLTPGAVAIALAAPAIALNPGTLTLTPSAAAIAMQAPAVVVGANIILTPQPTAIALAVPAIVRTAEGTLVLTPGPAVVQMRAPDVVVARVIDGNVITVAVEMNTQDSSPASLSEHTGPPPATILILPSPVSIQLTAPAITLG
jgi:hypothetical protein